MNDNSRISHGHHPKSWQKIVPGTQVSPTADPTETKAKKSAKNTWSLPAINTDQITFKLKEISTKSQKSMGRLKEKVKTKIENDLFQANQPSTKEVTLQKVEDLRVKKLPLEKVRIDFYQLMGYYAAYADWDVGDLIPFPGKSGSDYKVDRIIQNKRGLQIVVLIPQTKGEPPLLCCRGTSGNLHNLRDDFGWKIGRYGFKPSEKEIKETLLEVAKNYGPVVLTGHSLGGALAQIITANFCTGLIEQRKPVIAKTVIFNAPGAGGIIANDYSKNKQQLIDKGIETPKVFTYRHTNDLVSLSGGRHIETDRQFEMGDFMIFGHPIKILINAHQCLKSIADLYVVERKKKTLAQQITQQIVEGLRRKVALIGKIALKYLIKKQDMKLQKLASKAQEQHSKKAVHFAPRDVKSRQEMKTDA